MRRTIQGGVNPFSRERRTKLAEDLFKCFKIPTRYQFPPQLEEAALLVETGWSPDVLGEVPEALVQEVIIYKNVKTVTENGGDYRP